MADETTRIIVNIETLLKGLDKTLAGLSKVERQLKSLTNLKPKAGPSGSSDRLINQQQKLSVQTQELANRQERARQTTERLAVAQLRLEAAAARASRTIVNSRQQMDAHVRVFRANEQAARDFATRINRLGSAFRSIGQGMASFGATLSVALTAPLVAFGAATVNAATEMDSLQRGLTAIVGSAEEAGIQLKRLTEIAKLPGIGFQEAIQGSIRLQAVGFSAGDAEKALIQFSNAIALTGGGRDELARVTVQLGQLAAKGKVLSQDLRPIIEAAPAVGKALKQAFGTVNADDIANLTTNSREFLDTLIKELEKLPRASAGARNSFDNFRDAVFRASASVGQALLPSLISLIQIAEPIITRLAQAFAGLPKPLQTLVVIAGTLTAALGPALFIFGQFATGLGRVVVGLNQLSTLGLLPTIANLKTFNVAATATIARLLGLRAATVAAAGPWVALAVAIGAVAAAIVLSNSDELTAATEDQLKSTKKLVNSYESEIALLDSLKDGVAATADEQERLQSIYKALGIQAELRIKGLSTEEQRLAALRSELTKLLETERERLRIQGASIAGKFAQDLQKLIDLQRERLEVEQAITKIGQGGAAPRVPGSPIFSEEQIAQQLVDQHTKLNDQLEEQEKLVRQGAVSLKVYQEVSGDSADKAFKLARTLGGLEGVTADVTEKFREFADAQRDAVPEVKTLSDALRDQTRELLKAGDAASEAAKKRKSIVDAAVSLAREASDDLQGALKFMNAFIAAQPELRAAVEKEAKLAGKSFEEFVQDSLGIKDAKSGAALRNAQEALADALAKLAENSAENQIAVEKAKNDELLRLNDSRFKQELISLQEFVSERSRLQRNEIQGEIDRQRKLAELAAEDAARQQQRAGVTRGGEQIRARAAEQQALAKKIEAETKILDLQSRQKDIAADAENELRQFSKDRLRDFRELSRELDEILGKEKAAGEAAVDERFRETLRALNNEMALAQKILRQAALDQNVARVAAARTARDQIQSQITSIENHKAELKAVVALRDAQEQISRAEERQSNLERDIAFQVEFRGLAERDAIAQRLAGEKLVKAEIDKQRLAIEAVIASLKKAGLEIPLGLIEGVKRFEVIAKGLGESPFSEQFKLAEEDLGRITDELAEKIADVERAIRLRTISELEGRVIIRRLNGEYAGELERQLEILKEIAKQSGDDALKRQAQSAEQSVKDTRAAADELENLNAQLRSVSIDALGDALTQFFTDLSDNTKTAAEKLQSLVMGFAATINRFIAEQLSRKLLESIFGDPNAQAGAAGGLIGTLKRLLGIGGGGGTALQGVGEQAAAGTAAGTALQTGATAAAASLSTGGASAAATLTASVTGASASFSASVLASATAFASAVVAAGAAFAAAVATASASQGSIGILSGGGEATGNIIPPRPGGKIIRVAEAGFPEAVLTTDPRHAPKQLAILHEFLRRTRGLGGRIQSFAEGGVAEAEQRMRMSINRAPQMPNFTETDTSAGRSRNMRFVFLDDQRDVRNWINSPEGEQVIVEKLIRNKPLIRRLAT